MVAGGLGEGMKELALVGGLGMPLNPEHPASVRGLDRLGHAVFARAAADPKAVTEAVDGLVVMAAAHV